MRNYDDPVILRNITPVSGRIRWARHLAQKLEEPMEIFKQHPSVFQSAASRRVIHMYNRVCQVLLEYEMLYHSAWLKTIDVVDAGQLWIGCSVSSVCVCPIIIIIIIIHKTKFVVLSSTARSHMREFTLGTLSN